MIPDKPGYWWYRDILMGRRIAFVLEDLEEAHICGLGRNIRLDNQNWFAEWIGPVVDPMFDVTEFHQAMFPHLIATVPAIPANPIAKLRLKLIEEEYREMVAGLDAGDMVEIVDGALDLIYVVLGMLVSYGVNPWPIWQEVQRSNLAKASGPKRADGKQLKPPGWTPPDVAGCLEAQGWDGGQPR